MPDNPTAPELERYLHRNIPLSATMRVAVRSVGRSGVRLVAPLEANLNHRGTAFGGSLSTLAILSAWTLVYARLQEEELASRIVIQRNCVEYLRPVEGEFEAFSPAPDAAEWERFVETLRRRSRARIVLRSELLSGGELVGRFEGSFVAARDAGVRAAAG